MGGTVSRHSPLRLTATLSTSVEIPLPLSSDPVESWIILSRKKHHVHLSGMIKIKSRSLMRSRLKPGSSYHALLTIAEIYVISRDGAYYTGAPSNTRHHATAVEPRDPATSTRVRHRCNIICS
jgi:hypothetical protein